MTNILYTGDNLHFLNRLNSESVDLIYLDPPFNSKRTYSAPIGSKAAGASFKDMWTWDDVDEHLLETLLIKHPCLVDFIKSIQGMHGKPMMAYCVYMAQRIIEMHRILKDTGNLYLHCDPTASHYLKLILDKIFGKDNFLNEVIWCYSQGGKSRKNFGKKHDVILFYSKSNSFIFNHEDVRVPITPHKQDSKSKSYGGKMKTDSDGRIYIEKQGTRDSSGNYKYYKYYIDEGKIPEDWWIDINSIQSNSKERTGYPTQKPLSLLERIIKASSNEGDLVLDPFAGCATTCVAAQQLNRKWIGIDIEAKAASVLTDRLTDDAGLFSNFVHTHKLPERTDITIEIYSKNVKDVLYTDQGGLCNGCGTEFEIRHFKIDHIIPKSKGGSDTRENYQLLCGNCNRVKGDRPMEYLRRKIALRDEALSQQITFGR